jgi:hypothetical protein
MMTVRFPGGLSVTYDRAFFASRAAGYTDLYTMKDEAKREWIAQVPNTALIEREPASRVSIASNPLDQILHSLETRTIGNDWAAAQRLKRIKLALVDFDARRGCWK